MKRLSFARVNGWALAAAMLACGQLAVATVSEDRKRIAEARAKADADLVAEEAECQTRFAVTPCLLDAREKHRDIVDPLRRDQLTLDERERQQRAAARREHLSRKAEAAREAASAAAAASAPEAADAGTRITKPLLPIRPRLRSAAASSPEVADDAASASAPVSELPPAKVRRAHSSKRLTPAPDPNAARRAEARVQQAEERRARVLARNAERNSKKPPASPLPAPGASASAATPSPVR